MENRICFIKTHDKEELFTQVSDFGHDTWLVVVHGLGEHCERHNYMLELFKERFNILQFDLRGHGKSTGKRGYVKQFRDFKTDLDEVLKYLKSNLGAEKYILFGHSMGGLIVAGYMQKFVHDDFYPQKIFLSAPPAGVAGPMGPIVNKLQKKVFDSLVSIPYSFALPGLIELQNLSHDPQVEVDFIADSKTLKVLQSRLIFEMIKSSKSVFSMPLNLKCPGFCAIGSEDRIVDVQTLKNYFYEYEKGMELRIIPGGYHELHNEVDEYREAYFKFLVSSLTGGEDGSKAH